jgi:hypothetical protein
MKSSFLSGIFSAKAQNESLQFGANRMDPETAVNFTIQQEYRCPSVSVSFKIFLDSIAGRSSKLNACWQGLG